MFRRFSINFALFSMGLDAVLVALMIVLAAWLRPLLSYFPFADANYHPTRIPLVLYALFPVVWISILLLISVYDGRKNLRVFDEMISLTIGSLLAGVCLAGLLYLTYREISRLLFLFFVLITYLSMVLWRLIARAAFRMSSQKLTSQRRVLIAGAGPVGRQLQEQIEKSPHLAISVVGFLDDNEKKRSLNNDILGSLQQARQFVEQLSINDVVIALPQRAYQNINRLIIELHNLPVKVWVIPDYFHLALHKAVVEDFAGIPMLDLRAPALNEYQRMVKRAFDLGLMVILLIPNLILMAIIALAIRLEGPGPILFRQQRVGENGRLFDMLKFRTMVPGAENLRHLVEHYDEKGNFIHKTTNDPRVTRVGQFLRRTSLDEVPQMFNIFKGEMSMVGPRPELPYLVEQYEPWQRKRFAVPQGVTGWWQVNGRSDKPMHLHTEDDLYYVQNYSLLLDLFILIKTVAAVLRGKGAY